jgi:ATP-dependent protease ClpP protease subunit
MISKHIPNKIIKEDNGDNATVYLYGVIGQRDWWDGEQDITDVAFLKVLKDFEKAGKKRLDVRINSIGGSMLHMDGIIALMQSSSMEVHTWVDGLAASAAADIFLAAKKERRHIARNGKLMIHAPSTYAYGTSKALRDAADMLDVFEDGAIAQMAADTGMSEEDVKSTYFDGADHWLSARQAVDAGFVTAVEDYEAQQMPKDPEKMSAAELLKFYQPTKETDERSLLDKIIAAVTPQKVAAEPVSPPVKIDEEMNIENFKAAFGKEISKEDVTKFLQEQGFEVTQKAEEAAAPAVDVAKAAADAVAAAIKPLQDEIAAMKLVMDKTPGSVGPIPAKAAGDPPSGEGDGNTDAEAMKTLAAADVAAAKNWSNPFARV